MKKRAKATRPTGKGARRKKPAVLVTGAAGYVGGLTVAALAQRKDELSAIVALDVRQPPESDRLEGVEYVLGSVTDATVGTLLETHGIDTVVHLASILRTSKGEGEKLAYDVDVNGTRNVLEQCVEHGVKKLIVTTSGASYGYHADNRKWLMEEDPIRGNAEFAYSLHKRLIEGMLAEYRDEHPELQQLVFRPGTIVGENVSSPVTDLFEKKAMVGVLGSAAPFVFIWDQDVVACIVRGVFGSETGIFNLAGDGALTPKEIAQRLDKPYLPLPASALKLALGVLQRLGKTQYGPEQVKFLAYRPVLSNRRLKERFGYTPKTSRDAFEIYVRGLESRRAG